MCGLAGIVNINKLNNKDFLERQLNKSYLYLKARGPDEKGMWHDKNAFFLHTRLKILDLQNTSSQPMEYGNYVLSYNGEIYNFKDLKNTLIQKGYKFKSSGDTEVLIASWDYWGVEALNQLDGMFAFSIWDKKRKTLYLARDRFGKKPLVFSLSENSIAFASDIRSLKEIAEEENFESSSLYGFLEHIMLLPVVRGDGDSNQQKMYNAKFLTPKYWIPKHKQLREISIEWEIFRDEIRNGKAKRLPNSRHQLPGKREMNWLHMRPSPAGGTESDLLGNECTKMCFWLNDNAVQELLTEMPVSRKNPRDEFAQR